MINATLPSSFPMVNSFAFCAASLQHPSLVRESIEGELMARTKKVVITAFGDESKLAIVESDLNDPAAGEVQLSV